MRTNPTIREAMVTGPDSRVIASSDPTLKGKDVLTPFEKQQVPPVTGSMIFRASGGAAREAVAPVRVAGKLVGYAWVYEDSALEEQQVYSLVQWTIIFALSGAIGTAFIASFLARSITRPLNTLHIATQKLIRDPETKEGFPLAVTSANEAADLTRAFNLMVTSIEEQRAGLNDTLALLDSMLENAPIGFAFFDRKFRYVRVNQFLADMDQMPIAWHLGRTIEELLPPAASGILRESVQNVFDTGTPARDVEMTAFFPAGSDHQRSWLVNVYPVKTSVQSVRWVGAIIVETTERKRSEEALRKTEKLAAAGRLAASIAHEINNPLEATTNLLYLLRQETSLGPQARSYADSAQYELSRVAEMTQQTLRFYRQSTLPVVANLGELLDSVVTLFHGRLHARRIELIRNIAPETDLYCFAGEMRQLFANLVGNALDASNEGGRLFLDVRRSRFAGDGSIGVRIFVADNGCGMTAETRRRIFEPFFTTKDDTGTGLGLWVSDEIIHKHNGNVRVRSRFREQSAPEGKSSGTIFMIFFPEDGIGPAPQSQRAALVQQA
jgi:signal transduction histidine kinase